MNGLLISSVEQETGIGKDALRVWERRYGFPVPERTTSGERVYPQEQVEKLKLIKRLLDRGLRPNKIVHLSKDELQNLVLTSNKVDALSGDKVVNFTSKQPQSLAELVKNNRWAEFNKAIEKELLVSGIERFVLHTVSPLTALVGEAWSKDEISVYQEHQYTEQIKNILREAILNLSRRAEYDHTSILLTTLPTEKHSLGLLMAESLMIASGATCISLGTETPIFEIAKAVNQHKPDVLALSFSSNFNRAAGLESLKVLRTTLINETVIWAGGRAAFLENLNIEGVKVVQELSLISTMISQLKITTRRSNL